MGSINFTGIDRFPMKTSVYVLPQSMKNPLSGRPTLLSPAWNLAKRLFRLAALFYICLLIFTLLAANTLIFPSPPPSYKILPDQVALHTEDGLDLAGILISRPGAGQTILYSHGNGEDLGRCLPHLTYLAGLGFNVFAYDYRGYGQSQGKSGEKGVYKDIKAAWNYLVNDLHLPPSSILVYGRSLGSGPSTWLAAQEPCGGLILDCADTSTFKTVLPWLWFPNDKFPNLSRIGRVTCPVLVIHGTRDRTIPFSHGVKLYTAAPDPKIHLWVEGAGHNDLHRLAGESYGQAVLELADLAKKQSHQPSK